MLHEFGDAELGTLIAPRGLIVKYSRVPDITQVPHGEYKELTARGVPRTGTYIRGGNIATKGGVLFSAGTLDNVFRAYDSKTGKVLWETFLGGGAFATPSTYMVDGKQFVVVPVSNDLKSEATADTAGQFRGNQRRTGSEEWVVDYVAAFGVTQDRTAHEFDWLLGSVAGGGLLWVFATERIQSGDRPHRGLSAIPTPVRARALAHAIVGRFVLPMVGTST